MTVRTNREGGWIASFLIIGAVLVLGLTGTIYFLKTRNMDTELAVQNEDNSSLADENSDASKEKATADARKAEEKKKQDAKNVAEEKKAQEQAEAAASTLPSATEEQSSDEAVAQSAEELPETGPTETAMSLFVLTIVAFSVVSYVQSRSA